MISKYRGISIAIVSLRLLSLASTLAHADETKALRSWTPEDSVRLSYFSYSLDYPNSRAPTQVGIADPVIGRSPDGRYFFVISHHGDVEQDDNVYELLVWDARAVLTAFSEGVQKLPSPRIWRFRSTTSSEGFSALSRLSFIDDGKRLIFSGSDARGVVNVQALDLESGKVELLTHSQSDVREFLYAGGTVLYEVHLGGALSLLRPIGYPMEPVERSTDLGGGLALFPAGGSVRGRALLQALNWSINRSIYCRTPDGAEKKLEGVRAPYALSNWEASLSPNGRWLITNEKNEESRSWRGTFGRTPTQLNLVDLQTGQRRPLVQGLITSLVAWSPNSRYAILLRVKLDAATGTSPDDNVAIYDSATDKMENLPTKLNESNKWPRWLSDRSVLATDLVAGQGERAQVFEMKDLGWHARAASTAETVETAAIVAPSLPEGLAVKFGQTLNEPPVLMAYAYGRSQPLVASDPLLSEVWWAKAQPFPWQHGDRHMKGVLHLPRDYRLGEHLPVVIMVSSFGLDLSNQFFPDGYLGGAASSTVQSLVAHGIAVLDAGALDKQSDFGTNEVAEVQTQVEAVTRALVDRGIADPTRIGMAGFSRKGYDTMLAISHPGTYPLAAAITDDSFTGLYADYLGMTPGDKVMDRIYGGPFWTNKASWLDREPSFNMDRVRTPVLLTRHKAGDGRRLSSFERDDYDSSILSQVAMFDVARKPVDYLIFPDGDHQLQRPREIIALQNAVIDWFCFWLKGEIPANSDRAGRWANLRKMQDEVLKTPPPPKGKWVFVKDAIQPVWTPPESNSKPEQKTEEKKPETSGATK